jgi:hypothetical protein
MPISWHRLCLSPFAFGEDRISALRMWAVLSERGLKGDTDMSRLFVCDNNGWITVDIEANGPILGAALDHEKAEPIVRCAIMMALSALAEGGSWPTALLESMGSFMSSMRSGVSSEQLM